MKNTNVDGPRNKTKTPLSAEEPTDLTDDVYMPDVKPGQHFHMDFGFVRGSNYNVKEEDGPTVTSKDGYNSYLLIIDRATRFTWIFLTTSKHPPVNIAKKVLSKFKSYHRHRTVRIDQCKELGSSKAFREMVDLEGYNLELTGADRSSQNGMAEHPNKVFRSS